MDYLDAPEDFWQEPDTVLVEIIATLVNMMNMPVGVTLFINGMVLSGTLVSEREYLKQLTDTFRKVVEPGLKDADPEIASGIEELLDFTPYTEGFSAPDDDDFDPDDEDDIEAFIPGPIRYLHLTDVLVLTPQPSIAFEQSMLPILRIRTTMVDGWLLGQAVGYDGDEEMNGFPGDAPVLH